MIICLDCGGPMEYTLEGLQFVCPECGRIVKADPDPEDRECNFGWWF